MDAFFISFSTSWSQSSLSLQTIDGKPLTQNVLNEEMKNSQPSETPKTQNDQPLQIVWRYVVLLMIFHVAALYGLCRVFTSARLYTTLYAFVLTHVGGLGITAGSHRLWSHRAFKATWQLRVLLMLFNTLAFEKSVIDWSRDHRAHHKYNETNADPYNPKRGFFYSHAGWLVCKRHPDVIRKGKLIDFSDLLDDPILRFQQKYYAYLMPLMCFILPTVIPVYVWNETWSNAFFVSTMLRYVVSLNMALMVNSVAHRYGLRPYDKLINPADNKVVSMIALGDGWHNYHHVFPWDYKSDELGSRRYNLTAAFIDFFAWIGWAYDLKTASTELIRKQARKHGDGSHEIWGWGDKDQLQYERDNTLLL